MRSRRKAVVLVLILALVTPSAWAGEIRHQGGSASAGLLQQVWSWLTGFWTETRDEGWGLDPLGDPRPKADVGWDIDPLGSQAPNTDEGPYIDPLGRPRPSTDAGPYIDPLG